MSVQTVESLFALPPVEICPTCVAAAPRHWVSGMLMYCSHTRTFAVRVPGVGESWELSRGVKPKAVARRLAKWQATVRAIVARSARQTGMTAPECEQGLTEAWLACMAEQRLPGPRT